MTARGTARHTQVWVGLRTLILAAVSLAAIILHADVQAQTRRALLVGVSSYPTLPAKRQLVGPANDVALFQSLLRDKGFEPAKITVLADGVAGAGDPTRAAILAALDTLVRDARAGDFVFLLVAGHGSQMPVDPTTPQARDEPDGLHEIFLPRDVGTWSGAIGRVENAIADYELVERLDALVAKQVAVWAVFDTCHSASMMRSVGAASVRYRNVSPQTLGIPDAALNAVTRQALPRGGSADATVEVPVLASPSAASGRARTVGTDRGGFVAFYASQTTEATIELPLPDPEKDSEPHGLLSYTLAEAIRAYDGVTYRQVAQHLLQRYAALNQSSPTPLFTGTLLDAPMMQGTVGARVQQWPVTAREPMRIAAGALDQIAVGSELIVVPAPTSPDRDQLGRVRVTALGAMSAIVEPLSAADQRRLKASTLPASAYVRRSGIETVPILMRIAVAPSGDGRLDKRVTAGLERLRNASPAERRLAIVQASRLADADVRLHIEAGRVWFVGPGGQLVVDGPEPTRSLRIDQPEFEALLADSLQRVARALNLMRVAQRLVGTSATRNLAVELEVQRPGGPRTRLTADQIVTLRRCDRMFLRLRNDSRENIDVTALYLDAAFGIDLVYPVDKEGRKMINRLEPGAIAEAPTLTVGDDTTGLERLVVIATDGRDLAEQVDLSFLSQARLAPTRGTEGADVKSAFAVAAFGRAGADAAVRGKPAMLANEGTEVRMFSFRVLRTADQRPCPR